MFKKIISWLVSKTSIVPVVQKMYSVLNILVGVVTSLSEFVPEEYQDTVGKVVDITTNILAEIEKIFDKYDLPLVADGVALPAKRGKQAVAKFMKAAPKALSQKLDEIKGL